MDYDAAVFGMFGGRKNYESAIERLVNFAEIPEGSSVLELCCGTGISTRKILAKTTKVTAVEMNRKRMELATQHLPEEVRLLRKNALDLDPETDGTYDVVLCINGFHYFSPSEQFYDMARRMVHHNGRIIFNVKLKDPNAITYPVSAAFGDAKFELLKQSRVIRVTYQSVNPPRDRGFIESDYTEDTFTVPDGFRIQRKTVNLVSFMDGASKVAYLKHWTAQLKGVMKGHFITDYAVNKAAEKHLKPVIFGAPFENKLVKAELFVEVTVR